MAQIVKLSSGEEIIGEVTDVEVEGRTFIEIKTPAVIMLIPDQNNEQKFGIGLAPYAPYAEGGKVQIMPGHVVALMKPTASLLNEYNAAYGSGVVVPEKPKLVT